VRDLVQQFHQMACDAIDGPGATRSTEAAAYFIARDLPPPRTSGARRSSAATGAGNSQFESH
jgi:hypothetical protein